MSNVIDPSRNTERFTSIYPVDRFVIGSALDSWVSRPEDAPEGPLGSTNLSGLNNRLDTSKRLTFHPFPSCGNQTAGCGKALANSTIMSSTTRVTASHNDVCNKDGVAFYDIRAGGYGTNWTITLGSDARADLSEYNTRFGGEAAWLWPHLGLQAHNNSTGEPQWAGASPFNTEGEYRGEYLDLIRSMEPACIPASQMVSNTLGLGLGFWSHETASPNSGTESSDSGSGSATDRGMVLITDNTDETPPPSPPLCDDSHHQRHLLTLATADWVVRNEPEPRDRYGQSLLLRFLSVSDSQSGKMGKASRKQKHLETGREREQGSMQKKQSTYVCQFRNCGKRLERKDRALSHVRMHLGHRPFVCKGACGVSQCTEAFACQSYLKSHRQRPKEDCRVCGQSFFKKEMIKHELHCHYSNM
ncbi:hypothetical protein FRC14_003157 [Serendipita sp. 396]|nr:hypothetical protein FRC14_003157 [Serendipita sp. 396]